METFKCACMEDVWISRTRTKRRGIVLWDEPQGSVGVENVRNDAVIYINDIEEGVHQAKS